MNEKEKIYKQIEALLHTVKDIDFLYEIKSKIEAHEKPTDWADELTQEQKEELTVALKELDDEDNCISWEEYKKISSAWVQELS